MTMVEEIKNLPPLPGTILRIQALCLLPETDIGELSEMIESDPMLSANILKAVNSPIYGMSREIVSIQQAVMMFGVTMIRGFAAATAIKKTVPADLSPYGLTLEGLSDVSALQMALAREWFRRIDPLALPTVMSAAFLMELGKLIASLRLIGSAEAERFAEEIRAGKGLEETERCYLGMSSCEIAAMMFEHWSFDPALVDTLRGISDAAMPGSRYSQGLNVISKAVNVRGAFREGDMKEALALIEHYGMGRKAFEEAVKTVQSNIKQT